MTRKSGAARKPRQVRELLAVDVTSLEEASFWQLVDISFLPGACWNWLGSVENGYGRYKVAGGRSAAHRISYALAWGVVPQSSLVCHRCDNRRCVRPDHLFLGTEADNREDMIGKDRHVYGVRTKTAVLTEGQVRDILKKLDAGRSLNSLGKEYGVSKRAIHKIKIGENWAHISAAVRAAGIARVSEGAWHDRTR